MIRLYSIYDRKAVFYGVPFTAKNDEVMKRMVALSYKDNPFSSDLEVYLFGVFDEEKGELFSDIHDKFISSVTDILNEYYPPVKLKKKGVKNE